MTDKRFTIKEIDNFSYGIKVTDVILDNDGIELSQFTVCDLLNEQHETIQKLNQQLRIFSDGLKAEIRETKEVFEDYSESLDEKKQLKEENEQLKIALKDKENLISICEKKFKELGYLITCDDDGYTVEKI